MSESENTTPEEYKDRITSGKSWMEIVAWVSDLPPLPHVAAKAITLVEDPDTNAGQLSDLLSSDTALAARVLKIANSAMFSRQREITTLSQAIMVIGFKALKGIIVAATLRQLNRKFGEMEKVIWQNSMCTAMGSHLVSVKLKKDYVDEIFLLGLLHDLGKLVLIRQAEKEYDVVLEKVATGMDFNEAEQEVLGFSHPLIGALVAKKWNFSPEICQVILHHHDELAVPIDNPVDEKTAVIQLGNLIAHKLGHGNVEGYPEVDEQLPAAAELVGLDSESLESLLEDTAETFEQQSAVFN